MGVSEGKRSYRASCTLCRSEASSSFLRAARLNVSFSDSRKKCVWPEDVPASSTCVPCLRKGVM